MVFKSNIPQPTDDLSDIQQDLLANNQQLDTSMGKNHYPFTDLTAANGKHKFVQMPIGSTAVPPFATIPPGILANEGALYVQTSGTDSQLYYTPDVTGNEYQMTRCITASFGSFAGAQGWTFLPGGLLLQYGSFNPNTAVAVTFPIPFTGVPFSVVLTQSIDNNSTFRQAAVSTGTLTNTGFTYQGAVSAHVNPVYYMAIGV